MKPSLAPYHGKTLYGAFLFLYTLDWGLTAWIFRLGGTESSDYYWGTPRLFGEWMQGHDILVLAGLKILALALLTTFGFWALWTRTMPVYYTLLGVLTLYFLGVCTHNAGVIWTLAN